MNFLPFGEEGGLWFWWRSHTRRERHCGNRPAGWGLRGHEQPPLTPGARPGARTRVPAGRAAWLGGGGPSDDSGDDIEDGASGTEECEDGVDDDVQHVW